MFSYKRKLKTSFEEALKKTREELKKEGFSILIEKDLKSNFKEKLNLDFGRYILLGICNPALAHRVLSSEKEAGLFLPCNIILYEDEQNLFISTIRPSAISDLIKNQELQGTIEEIEEKLKNIVDSVMGGKNV